MGKRTVLTLDAGETTGYCLMGYDGKLISFGQIKLPLVNTYKFLKTARAQVSEIAYETFNLYETTSKAQIGSGLQTVELIGIIKLFCQQYEKNIACTERTPAQIKRIWKDKHLKQFGYYQPNKPHANDAIRHALLHIEYHKREEVRLLWK